MHRSTEGSLRRSSAQQGSLAAGIALIATMLGLQAAPTYAQPFTLEEPAPRKEAAENRRRGAALSAEGIRAYKQQSWAVAEAKFAEAFALNPSYDVATNLGNTQYRLGKRREAAAHLTFALRVWPLSARLEQRKLVTMRVAELRKTLATLTIRVNVDGAAVFVDGTSVGRAPLSDELFVEAGARVIEAKLDGFAAATERATVANGETKAISLMLVASPSAGSATEKPADPANVEGSGAPKKPGDEDAKASEKGGPNKTLVIAGVASSGALIAAGAALAIVSSVKAANADEQRAVLNAKGRPDCIVSGLSAECQSIKQSRIAKDTFGNTAIVSFAVGGSVAIGTLLYALLAPKTQSKPTVKALPVTSANGGGLEVMGSW